MFVASQDRVNEEKDEETMNKQILMQVRRIPHQYRAWEAFREQTSQPYKVPSLERKIKLSYIEE